MCSLKMQKKNWNPIQRHEVRNAKGNGKLAELQVQNGNGSGSGKHCRARQKARHSKSLECRKYKLTLSKLKSHFENFVKFVYKRQRKR